MEIIKKNIIKLEKEIRKAKEELKKACPHKNISPGFNKYLDYSTDYIFVCDDCGMEFITEDPNFVAYEDTK